MLTLTKSQVEQWQTWKLSEWATLIETRNQEFLDQLGRVRGHFEAVGASWSGAAHDAAYNRLVTEHDQDKKLAEGVSQLVGALRAADVRLDDERRVLLGRVADAQVPYDLNGNSIAITVGDDWTVSTTSTFNGPISTEALAQLQNEIRTRQESVNTAYFTFSDAVEYVNRLLETETGEIRAEGDRIGNGLEYIPAGTLSGDQGRADGETVADGKLSPEEIARISDNLGRAGLTPAQLDALGRGEEVNVSPAAMDYLTQFYDKAGRDGLIGVSDQLRADNSEPSQRLRQELANGLLTVSNEKVVARNTATGAENRGSWDKLNPEVREIISTRPAFGKDAPDANTRDLPDDYRPGPFNSKNTAGCLRDYLDDTSSFSDLLNNAGAGYEPGTRMGVELGRQGAHQGWLLDNGAYNDWTPGDRDSAGITRTLTENSAQDFLRTAGRSSEASYALITGNGEPELFGQGVPGQTYNEYSFDKMIGPSLGYEWHDNGAAVGTLFNWIGEDATSPDLDTATRAGEAASSLSNYIADNHNWLMNMDGDRTPPLGQVNPETLRSFSNALQPYIPNLAGMPSEEPLLTRGFALLDQGSSLEDSRNIFAVMDTDEQVAKEFNYGAALAASEVQSYWLDSTLSDPANPNNALARGYGAIQGLIDEGLVLEAADRTRDEAGGYARDYADKSEIYDFAKTAVMTGYKYIPVIGPATADLVSPVVDSGNTVVRNAVLGLYLSPDPATPYEVTKAPPAGELYQLAQALENRAGPIPHDPDYAELFDDSGQLKEYKNIIDSGVHETDLESHLLNIINNYNNGILAGPLRDFRIGGGESENDVRSSQQ